MRDSAPLGYELLDHAALTDVGVRRSHNQDAYGVFPANSLEVWQERGHIFLVADGMGAHAVGELASELAADLIVHTYQKHASTGPVAAIRRAFTEANATIHQRGQQNREFQGMGTTSTACFIRPEGVWIGHVGDSRAYRIREDTIQQLSFDHSLQWELARRQQVAPDRIAGVPSNVIVRSLGPEPNVQIDIEGPHPLKPNDIFIMCSDGLSNQLTDQEMGAAFSHLPLAEACKFCVDLANLRGGPDNITVVAVRVADPQREKSQENGQSAKGMKPVGNQKARLRRPAFDWQRLPWAHLAVAIGVGLAIVALLLVASEWKQTAVATFILSGSVLFAGIFGLVQKYRRDAENAPEQPVGPPQVYRENSCAIDVPLMERLMQTEKGLVELTRQKNWPMNWDAHSKHHSAAILAFQQGDLKLAFTEMARALAVLLAVLREHRQRDEQFKPNW
jgi:protein phosphatase